MARGFDSKSVADQQEAMLNARPARSEPVVSARRQKLELTKADLLRRLQAAASGPYEEMLRRSLAAVEEELARES